MKKAKIIGLAALVGSVMTAHASELTFVSWGGSYQASQEPSVIKPFAAKSGVKVKVDSYNGGVAQVRSQVQTNNVTWDVVDMQLSDAMRACDEGLLEKIAATDLAPAKDGRSGKDDYLPGAFNECLAGNNMWADVIVYNKDKFKGAAPAKVADFFDLKKFPGKRALKKSPDGALEWALMADGVAPGQVYQTLATPAGVERAFKKLDTIKSSIVWWETGAQAPQLLADGEVAMAGAYNGRIFAAISADKKPFGYVWDGQLRHIEGFVIVKGTKNLKAAKEFVRHATQPEALASMANATSYGPLRQSSLAHVDPAVVKFLPTAPENVKGALDSDSAFWADHADDLNQKFAVWLAR
ncbi:extracellular solute-binding protein [Aromatoleum toluvorans]|uniref:Extracellular solute-binding protein n=1 Tax=Aromatoleum toluvorans TaxID=92002 RepID=A0ABX1Q3Z6_9RHOO|nr:ABC transporter substrate-binding protein [Aromatoleum toluvorans]NMG46135.1 extracellular solute-binding protein [Aromatoleum toluvorans]